MSRALLLGGGAFRGAVQIPIIKHLSKNHYDAVYGVSVGAINGVMFAQKDLELLEKIWKNVDGRGEFLSSRFYWPINGLYSMNPLREKLERYTSLDELKIEFHAGVVSFTDGEYYSMNSKRMERDVELWDSVQASACMAGIMIPGYIQIDGKEHLGCDGGYRNIIPVPTRKFDHIDVVSCTPLDRMEMKKRSKVRRDIISSLVRGIEIFEDEIFDLDFKEIKNKLKKDGKINIYAPGRNPGSPLDASKSTISYRFDLGKEAIHNPIIIVN